MNKKEIGEIRRRLAPDKNAIGNVYGCYVNTKGEIIATFSRPLITLPREEVEKYLIQTRKCKTSNFLNCFWKVIIPQQ